MAEPNGPPDFDALLAALRLLHQELKRLQGELSRSEERADNLLHNLMKLEHALRLNCRALAKGTAAPPHRPRPPTDSTFLLKLAAQSGVEKLEFEWLTDGTARVRVDGGEAFHLTATLAAFLATLALEKVGNADRLVGWKPLAEVIERMQQRMGRPFLPHAIQQLVSRLRTALTGGGANPRLVQTDQRCGLRFALRRARGCEPA